jgi:uncharacterized protein YfaQ (DUF2300 family)
LLEGVRERVSNTQVEAIGFACDLMAGFHKLQGDKLKKYIQTGDPAELGELSTMNIKTYVTAVELLLKLTGQDKQGSDKKITGEIVHKHEVEQVVNTKTGLSQKQAAKILEIIDGEMVEDE